MLNNAQPAADFPLPCTHPSSSRGPAARRLVVGAVIFLSAAVLAACEPQAPAATTDLTALDTAAVRASIDSLGAVVMRANETGDAELFASTWAQDGVVSAPGSPPVVGRDSIVASFRRRPALPPGATMTIHPTEVQVLSGEWAYVMGRDTLTLTPAGGNSPVREAWTFLVVVRKTREGWQSYREVLTPNQ